MHIPSLVQLALAGLLSSAPVAGIAPQGGAGVALRYIGAAAVLAVPALAGPAKLALADPDQGPRPAAPDADPRHHPAPAADDDVQGHHPASDPERDHPAAAAAAAVKVQDDLGRDHPADASRHGEDDDDDASQLAHADYESAHRQEPSDPDYESSYREEPSDSDHESPHGQEPADSDAAAGPHGQVYPACSDEASDAHHAAFSDQTHRSHRHGQEHAYQQGNVHWQGAAYPDLQVAPDRYADTPWHGVSAEADADWSSASSDRQVDWSPHWTAEADKDWSFAASDWQVDRHAWHRFPSETDEEWPSTPSDWQVNWPYAQDLNSPLPGTGRPPRPTRTGPSPRPTGKSTGRPSSPPRPPFPTGPTTVVPIGTGRPLPTISQTAPPIEECDDEEDEVEE
ncbi:uncharacterized protein E0L32_001334 [Thyridium curvatum]|uniref:Uncharacterized protein n=1 Tax=Thyridium curvatum TaxID=1093900 RepID=A0A507ARQ1_9PEZI|nr:uncharacterized protein E0L32_001334 [Thyridium curvatum]TPX10137.1 hypothetical protein E0L32_001334 [Thyridium curvatum]